MTVMVDARTIVRDLEEAGVDPTTLGYVRNGLAAIASRIRDLRGNGNAGGPLVLREDVLRLVDPRYGIEAAVELAGAHPGGIEQYQDEDR